MNIRDLLNGDEKIMGITIRHWAGLYVFGLFCVGYLLDYVRSVSGGVWWSALIVAFVLRTTFIIGEEAGRQMAQEPAQKPKSDAPPQFNLPL